VAKGTNTEAVGKYKLISYRVEAVILPRATEVELGGRHKVKGNKYYRLIVTGGPFRIGNNGHRIWINDINLGMGVVRSDKLALTAIVSDSEVMPEGATIYVSWGDSREDRQALPETLKLKDAKRGNK
jgi:hypothetical protein